MKKSTAYRENMMRELREKGRYEQPGVFVARLLPATKREKIYGRFADTKPVHKWRVRITATGTMKEAVNAMMALTENKQ